jgi:hypothetical protein
MERLDVAFVPVTVKAPPSDDPTTVVATKA